MALTWALGALFTGGVAGLALVVGMLSGPVAEGLLGPWDLRSPWVFATIAVALTVCTPLSLIVGRSRAEPALAFAGTWIGMAVFSPLVLGLNSFTLLVLLPLLGSVLGLLPAITTRGQVWPLGLAWAGALAVGWPIAVALLYLDGL